MLAICREQSTIHSRRISRTGRRLWAWLVVAGFGLWLHLPVFAQQSPPVEQSAVARIEGPTISDASSDVRYRIGPGDVLSINVRKSPELSVDAVRVDQRGMIRIPMIEGDVSAACRTESDLADQITKLYMEYKRNPNVSVYVRDFQSRPVAVIGAINGAGQFRLQRRVRLAELLTFAGGPSSRAGRIVNIIHTSEPYVCPGVPVDPKIAPGSDSISVFKLDDTLKGKEDANPFVAAGDIVSVPDAEQVFIIGHVVQPQAIALHDKQITISKAIAMSGGPARDASTSHVRIIREIGDQGKQEMLVDLKAVMKQKAPDIILAPNDIVEVPSSAGKTVLTSLTGAIAPTLSNVPIRLIP